MHIYRSCVWSWSACRVCGRGQVRSCVLVPGSSYSMCVRDCFVVCALVASSSRVCSCSRRGTCPGALVAETSCVYMLCVSACACGPYMYIYCACVRACVWLFIYIYVCVCVCVCACMYLCVLVCVRACDYVCMYVCMHVFVRTCVRACGPCIHVCIYMLFLSCVRVCVWLYIYIRICVCMNVFVRACVRVTMCTCVHVLSHMSACMHLCVRVCVWLCTCICIYACMMYLCVRACVCVTHVCTYICVCMHVFVRAGVRACVFCVQINKTQWQQSSNPKTTTTKITTSKQRKKATTTQKNVQKNLSTSSKHVHQPQTSATNKRKILKCTWAVKHRSDAILATAHGFAFLFFFQNGTSHSKKFKKLLFYFAGGAFPQFWTSTWWHPASILINSTRDYSWLLVNFEFLFKNM